MGQDQSRLDGSTAQVLPWSEHGFLDQIDTAVYAVDQNGLCRRFNRAAEHLFGYRQDEVLGRSVHALLHYKRPDGSEYPEDECKLLKATDSDIRRVREIMWSRTGEALPVECSLTTITIQGEPGVLITAKDLRPQHRAEASLQLLESETAEALRQRDVAARLERELGAAEAFRQRELTTQLERAATAKLREQQELLTHVIQAVPVGIAVLDRDLRYRWTNEVIGTLLRSMGAAAPSPGDAFLPSISASAEVERIVREVQKTGTSFQSVAFRYDSLPNGRVYWNWSLTLLPDGELLFTLQDVTEQTLSQQALVESDKMAAIGRLAASISHEINNPLEAVTNLLYLVQMEPDLSQEARGYISSAEEELARVSRIASQTLRFHRHEMQAVQRTPQQLLDPVLALYEGRLKSCRVRVSVDFDATPPVRAYEGDIRQILNNLIGNSIDAMQRGGELRVRVRPSRCVRTGRPGIRILIADSGHGMSPEVTAHIFEPFFTTKGAAGSGLGLWISHTLAERNGGKLQVRSCREGNDFGRPAGTAFSLFIPNQDQPAATIQ